MSKPIMQKGLASRRLLLKLDNAEREAGAGARNEVSSYGRDEHCGIATQIPPQAT
jgi:hypothetical protein